MLYIIKKIVMHAQKEKQHVLNHDYGYIAALVMKLAVPMATV